MSYDKGNYSYEDHKAQQEFLRPMLGQVIKFVFRISTHDWINNQHVVAIDNIWLLDPLNLEQWVHHIWVQHPPAIIRKADDDDVFVARGVVSYYDDGRPILTIQSLSDVELVWKAWPYKACKAQEPVAPVAFH
jgi:hypothetical protein